MSGASAILTDTTAFSNLLGCAKNILISSKMNGSMKRPVPMDEFLTQMSTEQPIEKKARTLQNGINNNNPPTMEPNLVLPQPWSYSNSLSSASSMNVFANIHSAPTEKPQLPPLRNLLHLAPPSQRQEQQPLCPPFSKLIDSLSDELNQEYSRNHLWQSTPSPVSSEIPRLPNPLDILASAVSKKDVPAVDFTQEPKRETNSPTPIPVQTVPHLEQIPRITLPRNKGTSSKTWWLVNCPNAPEVKEGAFQYHNYFDEQWMKHYNELKEFYTHFGHTNVTRTTDEFKSLGNWVAEQRRKKRRNKLSDQQIHLLDQLKFEWDRTYYFKNSNDSA